MQENAAAQPSISPISPNVISGKPLPMLDPSLEKLKALQTANQSEPTVSLVNKNFWRYIFVFLVLLPVLTAAGIFGYQMYLNQTLGHQAFQTSPPQIDPRLVVTPDLLPTASSSGELPTGWRRYSNTSSAYSFGYPDDWTLDESKFPIVHLQHQTTDVQAIIFSSTQIDSSISTVAALASYVEEQDKQSAIRITVASTSASLTSNGLPMVSRQITKGSDPTILLDAYVALDRSILHIASENTSSNSVTIFDQMIRTVTGIALQPVTQDGWADYSNDFGYSLQYPNSVTVRSNDKNNSDQSNWAKSTRILLFPTAEIQNANGFTNTLELQLFDVEPPQSATQSATRDFGTREFKVYDGEGLTHYVGQLASGNWLQIAVNYDSNIPDRDVLKQVLETVSLKEPEQ